MSREADPPSIPKSLPSRAWELRSNLSLLGWIFAIMQGLFPGAAYLLAIAPPLFPASSLLVIVPTVLAYLWSYQREIDRPNLLLRGIVFTIGACVTFSVYLLLLNYLTVSPPSSRTGQRMQIGFYMFVLTEKAQDLIRNLPHGDPPIEINTPNDLLNSIGVWGGSGRTDELWPLWTIVFAGVALIVVFLSACLIWAYGLGILLRFFSSKDRTDNLISRLRTTAGHFPYESGFHGDRWHDVNTLFLQPLSTRAWAAVIARQARKHKPDVVCGSQIGGALVGQLIAAELGVEFICTLRLIDDQRSIRYFIPDSVRDTLKDRRVLVVSDLVSAGSVLQSTENEIQSCGGVVVAYAALIAVGNAANSIASRTKKPCFVLASAEGHMWTPQDCPLCKKGDALIESLSILGLQHHVEAIQVVKHSPTN